MSSPLAAALPADGSFLSVGPEKTAPMRLVRIAEVSSRRIWFEDGGGGLPPAASGKVVESLVQLAPTLPQSLALRGHRGSPADFVPDSAGQLDDRPRVGLEVQPPGWFGGTPPVHGHRDQVGPVFVVTDNHAPRLDGRPFILLAGEGETIFHTTSVHNLAELVRLAAERPVTGAFNCGDPDPPDVRRIARSIAAAMDHEWEEVLLPRELSLDRKVRNPWSGFNPWLLAMDKARDELGYEPVATYEDAIVEDIEWIVGATAVEDWREALPKAADYLGEGFDYEFEDGFLERMRR